VSEKVNGLCLSHPGCIDSSVFGGQGITDADHAFDTQTEWLKGSSKSMYVDAQAERVEWNFAPRRSPDLF